MVGCNIMRTHTMSNIVAKHLGVLFNLFFVNTFFSFFYFFFHLTPRPPYCIWNYIIDRLDIFIFRMENIVYAKTKKEGTNICNNTYIYPSFKEESFWTFELILHQTESILLILRMVWNVSLLKLRRFQYLLKHLRRYID